MNSDPKTKGMPAKSLKNPLLKNNFFPLNELSILMASKLSMLLSTSCRTLLLTKNTFKGDAS